MSLESLETTVKNCHSSLGNPGQDTGCSTGAVTHGRFSRPFASRVIEMRIRKGDTVEIISGSSKGQRGTVLAVDPSGGKLTVEGVNRVYKHVRRGHPKSPQGGRLHLELPIDASNVQLICPQTDKPTRVGVRDAADGGRELFARRSGVRLRQLSPPAK